MVPEARDKLVDAALAEVQANELAAASRLYEAAAEAEPGPDDYESAALLMLAATYAEAASTDRADQLQARAQLVWHDLGALDKAAEATYSRARRAEAEGASGTARSLYTATLTLGGQFLAEESTSALVSSRTSTDLLDVTQLLATAASRLEGLRK